MLIISKRKFMFKNVIGGSFITKGGGILEEAPDWIRETLLYDLALSDGDIIEVKGNGSDKDAEAALAKTEETTIEETAAEEEPEAESPVNPTGKGGKRGTGKSENKSKE